MKFAGINSIIRRTILNDKVVTPGRAGCAFNIDLPRSFLRKHPELLEFLNGSNFWYGAGRWVLAGNMPQHGDRLNLCLSSNKIGGMEGEWYQRGDLNSVKEEFKDFDPRIIKLLNGTDPSDCYIWRISDISPLPTWISDSGKLVIIGDSAHAMVPSGGMVCLPHLASFISNVSLCDFTNS
jgi:salicylate hydroxylase